MTYRFKEPESIPTGIKRIATEQVAKAIDKLSNTDDLGVDEAVHQARKRLKKTRAVIRLVRDRLSKQTYKQENARFRDLGRVLSNLRDSSVQIETLDRLTTHFADTVEPEAFVNIRRELRVDYRREYQRVLDAGAIASVKNQLKDIKIDLEHWAIKSDGWKALDSNIKRVYKRGYQALDQAKSEPTAESLHDWRKRVKYLRHQLEILRPIWSKLIQEWVDQTHDLSDYLGEDHDLAVLQKYILSQPERFNRDHTLEILTALIDRRRTELQSAAVFLGSKIYTEKPKDFVDRLGNYWQIWQEEIEQSTQFQ